MLLRPLTVCRYLRARRLAVVLEEMLCGAHATDMTLRLHVGVIRQTRLLSFTDGAYAMGVYESQMSSLFRVY